MRNEKLREALSFHTLLVGGNPMTTSAIYALIHKLEKDGGVWFAMGGTNRLIAGMVRQFERLGGEVRLGDPVAEIETAGEKATGVRTSERLARRTPTRSRPTRDIVHTYRDLLKGIGAGRNRGAQAGAQALFAVAVRGPFRAARDLAGHPAPHDPVRAALQRAARRHLRARRAGRRISRSICTTRPSPIRRWRRRDTRPSMRWRRCRIWASCRSTGTLNGPNSADRILDEVGAAADPRPARADRDAFHYAPPDFAHDLNAHLGCAFSLEPMLTAIGLFPRAQPRRRDPQPLLRRRGHASGRGHSRRRRQRQGDRGLMIADLAA